MDAVKLTIKFTPKYRERIEQARSSEDLRKCRPWNDLLNASADQGEVEINQNGIFIKCNTRKGTVEDSCTYDGVLAVTEMRDGILLRLSHKRLLWLPTSENTRENELLMDAMMLLSKHCNYLFRKSRLKLKGVGLKSRLLFCFRPRQGYNTGNSLTTGIIIGLICLTLFAGTVFVTQPFHNRKIDREDAIPLLAVLDRVDRVYGKGLKYIDLEFQDADDQTVRSCCLGYGLLEKLESLPSGTPMQLLIHPDTHNVLQIQAEGENLLDFDYAQEQLWSEAMFFVGFGIFMFAGAVFLSYLLIRKKF